MQWVQVAITVVFWVAVATLAVGLVRRIGLWRNGRDAPVDWAGLLAIPKRYLVDIHHVVSRDSYMSNTHVAVAGGAVAALALVALNYGLALYQPWLDWLTLVAAAVMLVGSYFVWARRRDPPSRLSKGPWSRLPYTLAAFAVALVGLMLSAIIPASAMTAAFALPLLLLFIAGSAELALGIGSGGPMKHAVAGLLHLGFHPRRERFTARSVDLRPLDLEAGDFGVGRPEDFRWNQLLSFDACVQCGKCEAACPAFAAGQPLNPKKLIQDMVVGLASGSDASFAGSPYPGIPLGEHGGAPDKPIIHFLVEPETLWSLHHLSCLRRGMPDADRACRRHCGPAPQCDPHHRRTARYRSRNARQSARDRHHRRPQRCHPPALGHRSGRRPCPAGQAGRCAAGGRRGRLRHALPAHATRFGQIPARRQDRLRRAGRQRVRHRRHRTPPGRRSHVPGTGSAQHRQFRPASISGVSSRPIRMS